MKASFQCKNVRLARRYVGEGELHMHVREDRERAGNVNRQGIRVAIFTTIPDFSIENRENQW